MNRANTLEAHKLYTAISEMTDLMVRRLEPFHHAEVTFRFNTRPNTSHIWTSLAETDDLKRFAIAQEVAAFALLRLNEERQKKINEWGRRLAQLGFEKPEVCK